MPTYEYQCTDCEDTFTRSESMTEHVDAAPRCPTCDGENVRQVMLPFFARTSKKS